MAGSTIYQSALDELAAVFDAAVARIAAPHAVVVFGGRREGLQIRGFAMHSTGTRYLPEAMRANHTSLE